MVTAWNVLKRLEHFMDFDTNEKDKALSVCVANLEKVLSKLKPDSDRSDCRITEAAAAMSYYDFAVRAVADNSEGVTSFKAGDVSVSKSHQSLIEIASDLRRDALGNLAPLCADSDFFITLA